MVVMYVLGLSLNVFYSFGLCLDYRNIFSGDMVPVIFGRMDVAVYFIRISKIRRHLIADKREMNSLYDVYSWLLFCGSSL